MSFISLNHLKIGDFCKEKNVEASPIKRKEIDFHSTPLRRSPRKSFNPKDCAVELNFRKKKRKVRYLDSDDEEIAHRGSDKGKYGSILIYRPLSLCSFVCHTLVLLRSKVQQRVIAQGHSKLLKSGVARR